MNNNTTWKIKVEKNVLLIQSKDQQYADCIKIIFPNIVKYSAKKIDALRWWIIDKVINHIFFHQTINPLKTAQDKNTSHHLSAQGTSSSWYRVIRATKTYIENRMLKLKLFIRTNTSPEVGKAHFKLVIFFFFRKNLNNLEKGSIKVVVYPLALHLICTYLITSQCWNLQTDVFLFIMPVIFIC